MKTVLITGLEKEFDKKLAGVFSRENFTVFSLGEYQAECTANAVCAAPLGSDFKKAAAQLKQSAGHIDIYVDVTDVRSAFDSFDVRSGLNDNVMRELYDANVIRPMAMLEVFYPLLETGQEKRLCYLTSAGASINETRDTDGYAYKMAKAGLHNFLQITRNVLAPRGFTLRAFDPMDGEIPQAAAAEAAFNYFIRRRGTERGDPKRDDETNLVFRDAYGRQHSW